MRWAKIGRGYKCASIVADSKTRLPSYANEGDIVTNRRSLPPLMTCTKGECQSKRLIMRGWRYSSAADNRSPLKYKSQKALNKSAINVWLQQTCSRRSVRQNHRKLWILHQEVASAQTSNRKFNESLKSGRKTRCLQVLQPLSLYECRTHSHGRSQCWSANSSRPHHTATSWAYFPRAKAKIWLHWDVYIWTEN